MKTFLVILLLLAIFCAPLATIASLNVLFGLAIPNTFSTYFAAMWLGIVLGGGVYASRNV